MSKWKSVGKDVVKVHNYNRMGASEEMDIKNLIWNDIVYLAESADNIKVKIEVLVKND